MRILRGGIVKTFGLLNMMCVVFVFCAAKAIASPAQIFTTLHSFCAQNDCTDGAVPFAGLVQASDGNLYGTTFGGGANDGGTVFKITPDGTLSTLYSFCSQQNCTDGGGPFAGLIQASDGNLYGTTGGGGTFGYGTVFKITPSGILTTLYSFCSQANCADGASPRAGVIQASDGNFYGTTVEGGAILNCSHDCGTVFRITPSGTLTALHSFNGSDGRDPLGGLVQGTDGNFYGTTTYGGASDGGTVFKITPSGTLTTLCDFCAARSGCADGVEPTAGLIQATNGNFYGTASDGGANDFGTVFKISPSGTLTTLHSFGSGADGQWPFAVLVQATDGNLYGTTYNSVFKISPDYPYTLTTLHTFDGTDGANPVAGLVQATDGNFYGTTSQGGAYNQGTIFRLVSVRPCFSCALEWK